MLEQLAAIDLTLALVVFLNGTNGIRPIQGYATPALREELLPRLASGRELAAFALSEPAAGANVGGIASQARPDGRGGWRIRGLKRWNSSSWAGVISVFARLVDDTGPTGRADRLRRPAGKPGAADRARGADDGVAGQRPELALPGRRRRSARSTCWASLAGEWKWPKTR